MVFDLATASYYFYNVLLETKTDTMLNLMLRIKSCSTEVSVLL